MCRQMPAAPVPYLHVARWLTVNRVEVGAAASHHAIGLPVIALLRKPSQVARTGNFLLLCLGKYSCNPVFWKRNTANCALRVDGMWLLITIGIPIKSIFSLGVC
jgi:hypothetical protein